MGEERDFQPLFTWRSAVCDSVLPPPCRHVLLTLSLHMNERGGSCFPSIARLAQETGLDRSTVIRHLHVARDNGWLEVTESSTGRTNRYTATVPPVGQPSRRPVAQNDRSHRTTVAENDLDGRTPPPQGSQRTTLMVAQNDPSTSGSSSVSSSVTLQRTHDRFEEFWAVYPRRAGKAAAQKSFARAVKVTNADDIIEGARRYSDDPNREDEYTAHPSTWLNQGRWDDDPLPAKRGTRSQANAASAAKVAHAVTAVGNPLLAIGGGR